MGVIKAFKIAYEQMVVKGWSRFYVFVDVHGTIIKPNHKYGDIPTDMYPFAEETLQLLTQIPEVCLVLYTCSHHHEILEYLELFKGKGIRFDYINENPEIVTQMDGYGCYDKKPYINVLFEDKAGFDPEVEWLEVLQYLKGKYKID